MPTRRSRSHDGGGKPLVALAGSWTAVPNDLLRDSALTPRQRLIGALLYVYAGNSGRAYPVQGELAKLLGVDKRTVQSDLRCLITARYVVPQRTVWGNVYSLEEPNKALTKAIPRSHAETIPGSPPTIPGSPPTIPGSHASFYDQTHDLDSSSSEGAAAPVDGDEGRTQTIRGQGDPRVGKLLKDAGVALYKELQNELAHVPYELVARRVNFLVDQGKEPGIIVHSLRLFPLTPGAMDELGPQPTFTDKMRASMERLGLGAGRLVDDDQALDDQALADDLADAQAAVDDLAAADLLERSDPDLADFFKECDL